MYYVLPGVLYCMCYTVCVLYGLTPTRVCTVCVILYVYCTALLRQECVLTRSVFAYSSLAYRARIILVSRLAFGVALFVREAGHRIISWYLEYSRAG